MPAAAPLAVVACGALAADVRIAAAGLGRPVEVHSLSALLHNRPSEIAPRVEELARRLRAEAKTVLVAYADCGTYGALDEVCGRLGLERLPGLHCYDILAGERGVSSLMEEEPGTYLLTDFLLRSFRRLVIAELGLDRHPELVVDYFGNYRRIVWLTTSAGEELLDEARFVAQFLRLDLVVRKVPGSRVGDALVSLIRKKDQVLA